MTELKRLLGKAAVGTFGRYTENDTYKMNIPVEVIGEHFEQVAEIIIANGGWFEKDNDVYYIEVNHKCLEELIAMQEEGAEEYRQPSRDEIFEQLKPLIDSEFDKNEIICAVDTDDVVFVEDAYYVPCFYHIGQEHRVTTYHVYTEHGELEDSVLVVTFRNEKGEKIIEDIF